MHNSKNLMLTRLAVGSCLLALLLAIIAVNPSTQRNGRVLPVAQAPQNQSLPPPVGTAVTTPIPTPPTPVPTTTPVPAVLQPATAITPTLTVVPASVLTSDLTLINGGNTAEPLSALTWAPTGDKLVYVTRSGKLYWSNLDGSSATLLPSDSTLTWQNEQRPMTNTLFLRGSLLRFTKGQPPVLRAAPATAGASQFHWWSSDRVSGVEWGDYVGGNMLLTFDANGNLVDRRNIPYMAFGAVQPGGQWLAYVTNQQATSTPFYGSDPQTVYLLNLHTGQRLRVTPPGMEAWYVENWSPDGNWFVMSADVNGTQNGVLVSANGQQWTVLTAAGILTSSAVWSPDSQKLAFIGTTGGDQEPNAPRNPSVTTDYIFRVPSMTTTRVVTSGPGADVGGEITQPRWSPDGTRLAYLPIPPVKDCYPPCSNCLALCSGTSPAFYIVPSP